VKVLVVHPGPNFSVADVYTGLVKGLRANGAEVGELNLDDRLTFYETAMVKQRNGRYRKALNRDDAITMAAAGIELSCYRWWPDVIVVVSGMFIPPIVWGVLARRPHHTVLWCTESPYEDSQQAQPARYVDTVILNDPTNIEQMRAVNPRTWYMPHSYDPDLHFPGPAESDPEFVSDFAFVGTGFPSRIEFFEKVDWSGIDAKFAGNWTRVTDDSPIKPLLMHERGLCCDNADTARLYRSAKVTANVYRKEINPGGTADGWAIGPREVELAACGSFFMREPRGEGDGLFPMLPTFTTPVEFQDALRWWLAHPDERESAAAQARAAIADRTFTNAAARLLQLVDGAPSTLH